MATPRRQISFSDMQTEYGGTNPISLSEFYTNGNAPDAGLIRASNLVNTDVDEALTNEAIAGTANDPNAWFNVPTDVAFGTDFAVVLQNNFESMTIHDTTNPDTFGVISFYFDDTEMPDPFKCVLVENRWLYIANFNTDEITIYDLADPLNPLYINRISAGGNNIVYDGADHIYVSRANLSGFAILDITTRNAPVVTIFDDVNALDEPNGVAIDGPRLYISDITTDSVVLYDVSTPGSPVRQQILPIPDAFFIDNLHVGDGVLVAAGFSITTIDADPDSTTFFQIQDQIIFDFPNSPFEKLTVEDVEDVVIDGDNLWVLQQVGCFIERYDISDPTNITYLDSHFEPLLSDAGFMVKVGDRLIASSLDHDGIAIIDITDPAAPFTSNYIGPDYITAGFATIRDGDYLYVANYYDGGGLFVYDITRGPDMEREVGRYQNSIVLRGVRHIIKKGDVIFAACNFSDRFVSIDVSDPTNPRLLDWLSGDSRWVIFDSRDDNFVYVSSNNDNTIRCIDVTDPANMSIVEDLALSAGDAPSTIIDRLDADRLYLQGTGGRITVVTVPSTPGTVGMVRENGFFNAALSDPRDGVRVGDYYYCCDYTEDAIAVWDISTADTPTYVTSLVDFTDLSGPVGISASGDGQYLYIAVYFVDRFTTVDISTPATPTVVAGSSFQDATFLPGCTWCFTDPDEKRVWIQCEFRGAVTSVNVEDPANPYLESSIIERMWDGVDALCSNGRHLYAYAENTKTLTVSDMGGLRAVHLLNDYTTNVSMGGTNIGIDCFNDRVFIPNPGGNLTVVNVENPNRSYVEAQLADAANFNGANDVVVEDGIAWVVSDTGNKIVTVNVTDPTQPAIMNTTTMTNPSSITKDGDYLYITSAADNRFSIYDTSIFPNGQPVLLGSIQDNTNFVGPYRPTVNGNYAYVGAFNTDQFHVIDITNKAAPTFFGSFTDAVNMQGPGNVAVNAAGTRAYIGAITSDAVVVADITTKNAPAYVAQITDSELDGCRSVLLKGNLLYAAGAFDDAIVTID